MAGDTYVAAARLVLRRTRGDTLANARRGSPIGCDLASYAAERTSSSRRLRQRRRRSNHGRFDARERTVSRNQLTKPGLKSRVTMRSLSARFSQRPLVISGSLCVASLDSRTAPASSPNAASSSEVEHRNGRATLASEVKRAIPLAGTAG